MPDSTMSDESAEVLRALYAQGPAVALVAKADMVRLLDERAMWKSMALARGGDPAAGGVDTFDARRQAQGLRDAAERRLGIEAGYLKQKAALIDALAAECDALRGVKA